MKKHLIFISFPEDIGYVQKLISRLGKDNENRLTVICNNAEALFLLKQLNIPTIDSQKYFPHGNKLRQTSNQVINISKQWADQRSIKNDIFYQSYNLGKIAGYCLWLHLCECQHSLMVATNIIEQVKPDIIHISPLPTESQLKKYQSGKLNCENLALIESAKQRKIKIRYFRINFSVELFSAIKLSVYHFFRCLKYSLRQFKSSSLPSFNSKLFILANDYQLFNLQPFIKYLNGHKLSYDLFGKATSTQDNSLKNRNIKLNRLTSMLPIKTNISNLKIINFLKYFSIWIKHNRHIKNYYDSINPVLWQLIKWKFFYLYTIQFPEIIETLDLADNLFDNHPRLFLTAATADIFNKCFAISARKNKVRTIELNHGLIIYDEEAAFRCNDRLAVWGPAFKSLIKKNKTTITGHPSFDNPTTTNQINKLRLSGRKKYHLSLDQNVLLVLAALPIASDRLISDQSEYSFLNIIFDSLIPTKKTWTIIFRTHPSNDVDWLKQIPIPSNIRLIPDFRKIPLNEAVAASDVIISNLTTSLIEGIFQDKPVFVYPFLDYSASRLESHPLITSGATHVFQTSRELTKLLVTHANNQSWDFENSRKFLRNYCSVPTKISSSQKLYNIIQKELAK